MRTSKKEGVVAISTLFDVYKKKIKAPQKTVVHTAIEIIHDVLGVQLSPDTCEFVVSNKTLHIKARGPIKSEIMMRKEEIIAHLKGRLGEKSAPKEII